MSLKNCLGWGFLLASILVVMPIVHAADPKQSLVSIGTSGLTGLYYPAGGAICKLLNEDHLKTGIHCSAEVTDGSIANINSLRKGEFEFALVQSDWQYQAFHGSSVFADPTPFKNLRAVFSIHGEPFTVVVKAGSGIQSIDDLLGKRVNIGNLGSGQRATMELLMKALGWNNASFKQITELKPNEQAQALCDDKIDAFVYTVGHPNDTIKDAASTCPIRIVSVTGPEIKHLMEQYPYYVPMIIPAGIYKGNRVPVQTFGVKATLVTTSDEPDAVVYALVKDVFDNLVEFKSLHPAFSELNTQNMLLGNSAPYAEGAYKYFKEKGLIFDVAT